MPAPESNEEIYNAAYSPPPYPPAGPVTHDEIYASAYAPYPVEPDTEADNEEYEEYIDAQGTVRDQRTIEGG